MCREKKLTFYTNQLPFTLRVSWISSTKCNGNIISTPAKKEIKVNVIPPPPFHSKGCNTNSPYCLSYDSNDVISENLVLDQLTIPWFIFFYILITCQLDIEMILKWYWNDIEMILEWYWNDIENFVLVTYGV